MSRSKAFTRVSEELAAYLERTGVGERIAEAGIVPEWAERVGPAIAAVTTPLRAGRGTLFVAVRSSAWLMELHMLEREIVRRLNAGREKGHIDRIRFVMAESDGHSSHGESWPEKK